MSVMGILGAVGYIFRGLADLLVPEVCAGCGAGHVAAGGMCDSCNVRLLSLVAVQYCPRCGASIGPNIPVRQDGCAACPTTLPRFARVVRLGPYTEPLRHAIHQLKYRRQEAMLSHLGALLCEAAQGQCSDDQFDLVMPVPMHWRRRYARGHDHAMAIARSLARRMGLPMGSELMRVRNTPPQVHLSRSRRIENVRGAFAVSSKKTIEGAHVLLVDDVTTTGATANECARTLLGGGALRVTLAVLAKSEPPTAYAQHIC